MAKDKPEEVKADDKKQLPTIQVGQRGLALTSLDELYRFAKFVCGCPGFAPPQYKTPEQVMIAMQYGAEVGLSYMQSLQCITIINSRPSLWGDALPGLVQSSGKCEYIKEWYDATTETAHCESKRRDQTEPKVSTFSREDAFRAGLWGKAGPWTQYPQRMLQIRARAFNLRDNFSDVLRGLAVVEEVHDYTEPEEPLNYEVFSDQDEPTPT